jgi:ferritin-like metal-binding protein YciE
MAELTQLDTKIAEVIGLAQAAQGAIDKVSGLVEDSELKQQLEQVKQEAVETEERTTQVVENLDGKKTAILEKARETKQEATEMMRTYLGDDADDLDGFEFLTMAEAGEVGHWQILGTMNQKAGNQDLQQVIEWVTPIQERHFQQALKGSLQIAAEEDPNEPA